MLRLPAEWEPASKLLIAWPHTDTDWNYMLDEVCGCYTEIVRNANRFGFVLIATPEPETVTTHLIESGINPEKFKALYIPTNDTWARDFGPITLVDNNYFPTLLDFKFNGWGLKFASDKDNLITRRLIEAGELNGAYANRLNFVLEGGSVESNGTGTLLTTSECLLSPNRNGQWVRNRIESYLKENLHVRNVLWLDHGALEGDDTDSHIDTLARLAPDNAILYVKCDHPEDSHYTALSAMERQLMEMTNEDGLKFTLYPLPHPEPIYDEDGLRLPATYANFLIFNEAVLVPIYCQPENDSRAIETISKAFPGYEVIGIDCRPLIKQHGSLHCVTMQLPGQQ